MAKSPQSKPKPATRNKRNRNGDGTGTKAPRKRGRPTKFTEALGEEICSRLIGGETLDSICRDARMPKDRVTIFRWRRANVEFDRAYLSARGDQMEALADQVLEIAAAEDDIARARLKLDARRIVLGRLATTYAARIEASTPAQEPFSLAEAMKAARERIEKLVAEVGRERAEQIRQDQIIEKACNPPPGYTPEMVRGEQRVAMSILERRKADLLNIPKPENPN